MSDATTNTTTTAAGAGGAGVNADETDRLIASDKVEGTAVYNRAGERLGSVYNVMIDKFSGQVAYAVMSFGGFLGIGERYHPLPWRALTYDTGLGGYVVDVTREQLEGAPSYGRDEAPWGDPAYGRGVSSYYGVSLNDT
jgi:PRC-barrel domain